MDVSPLDDVVYMRFYQRGNVLRVAKVVPLGGLQLALYPSGDPTFFYGEAFREADDSSSRTRVQVGELKDDVWKRLLKGDEIEAILRDYEPLAGDGCDNGASYLYARRGSNADLLRARTFRIANDNDEDAMLAQQEARRNSQAVK